MFSIWTYQKTLAFVFLVARIAIPIGLLEQFLQWCVVEIVNFTILPSIVLCLGLVCLYIYREVDFLYWLQFKTYFFFKCLFCFCVFVFNLENRRKNCECVQFVYVCECEWDSSDIWVCRFVRVWMCKAILATCHCAATTNSNTCNTIGFAFLYVHIFRSICFIYSHTNVQNIWKIN